MIETYQKTLHAYIDEAGDPELDLSKGGVSEFYIVCAVLVEGDDRDRIDTQAQAIRAEHFGPGEMKSSKVGSALERRHRILAKIGQSGIKFCAVVGDKKAIDRGSGLQFRQSFVKYLHGILLKRLYRTFTALHIRADQHGRSSFMEGFKTYLAKRYQKELFDHADFEFVPSSQDALVQTADMIAGSLLRVYSGKDPEDVLGVLSPFAVIIERWPPSDHRPDLVGGLGDEERFDHLVSQQSILQARAFVREHSESAECYTEAQVETIRYLLYQYELLSTRYVCTAEILQHLNTSREELIGEHAFRLQVIAKLRNEGVLIASSNQGYKIPNCSADMQSFVSLVRSQAIPYMRRLGVARRQLLLASNGEYDIVPRTEFPELADCMVALDKVRFEHLAPAGPAGPPAEEPDI